MEVLNLLEEVAEYVSESREHPNAEGTLRYYRREIACASQKVTMKLMVARLDLVRARSNQHRHHWTNNDGLTNYLQEESMMSVSMEHKSSGNFIFINSKSKSFLYSKKRSSTYM